MLPEVPDVPEPAVPDMPEPDVPAGPDELFIVSLPRPLRGDVLVSLCTDWLEPVAGRWAVSGAAGGL